MARDWLLAPNSHGRPNCNVLKPWANGAAVVGRWPDTWIIDFAVMSEAEAALYELPFEHVRRVVLPQKLVAVRERRRRLWWQYNEPAPGLRRALTGVPRYIATPEVSKHRLFVWLNQAVAPDKNLVAIARSDDTSFGILHARFHTLWALRLGTSLEDRPRYTSSTTFRTFPFPAGLTPNLKPSEYTNPHAAEIGAIAARLNELRENWLNPPEWTDRVPEVVPGYPDRIIAKPGFEEQLKKRTLTNLYNERPTWLANVHRELDAAVAKAYGWTDYSEAMSDEEILGRLLALNLARSDTAK